MARTHSRSPAMRRRLWTRIVFALTCVALVFYLCLSVRSVLNQQALPLDEPLDPAKAFESRLASLHELNVAVFEDTPYHDEVIGGVLAAMREIGSNTTLYRRQLNKGFGEVISDVWDIRHRALVDPNLFATHLDRGDFDTVILVTCDTKFWGGRADVIRAFSARKDLHVVCLVHETEGYGDPVWNSQTMVSVPGAEGRLSFLTLSPHSHRAMEVKLQQWTREGQDWRRVQVFNFAPVFPLPRDARGIKQPGGTVSKAAIVGRINNFRQYDRIIDDLYRALVRNPTQWGYSMKVVRRKDADGTVVLQRKFLPLPEPARPPPFTLNLIGYDQGSSHIPPELLDTEGGSSPIVIKHSGGDYRSFYTLLGSMDIILPAFSGIIYTTYRSSASIPAAVIVQVPLLVDDLIVHAYEYLPDAAYVRKPESLSEIDFIGSLRYPDATASELEWSHVKNALDKLRRRDGQWPQAWQHVKEYNVKAFAELLDPRRLGIDRNAS